MMGGNDNSSSTSLAPGFRFHPTDEELVSYYLKRKVCGKPFRFDAISEIEIYKAEPWDLPGLSKLKSRDLEWYFFSVLDKKYGNGSRTNRTTVEGYWKTTGKDRPVQHKCRVVGMKKTLVYHRGRAPRGERTNWVMHEYKLADEELEKAGIHQESFALCRVFCKSGTGPKNGEQYGAPFVEEEWDNENEVDSMPGETFDDAIYVTKVNDIEQNHGAEPSENSAPQLNIYQGGESSNFVQEPTNNVETDPKPFSGVDEGLHVLERNGDKKFINLPLQPEMEATKSDFNTQPPISVSHAPSDYQPEAQCFDNINSIDEGFFLEANDLSDPIEAHSTNFELDDYLKYFDADDDIAQYLDFDSSESMDVSAILSDQSVNENLDLVAQRPSMSNQQSAETNIAGVSSFKQVKEAPNSKSDSNYTFMKQASRMLGSFHAPPAFASEFPTKEMAARLQAAAQSSDSVHVSTGMLNIRNLTMNYDTWSFDKLGNLNVQVSFNLPLPEGIVSPSGGLESLIGMASGKIASVLSRSWFYNFFFGVIILAISAKLGTCIYAK